jgi:hypothetical protein
MSDLPGTPRRDIDPAIIQDQLEKLTAQVARLMESQQATEAAPKLASQHRQANTQVLYRHAVWHSGPRRSLQ